MNNFRKTRGQKVVASAERERNQVCRKRLQTKHAAKISDLITHTQCIHAALLSTVMSLPSLGYQITGLEIPRQINLLFFPYTSKLKMAELPAHTNTFWIQRRGRFSFPSRRVR